MTKTPRTDALLATLDFPWSYSTEMVARHAEQLERELAAMTENAILKDQAIDRHLSARTEARPRAEVLELARRIVTARGDSGRDLAHDAYADEVAAELLRVGGEPQGER